MYRNMQNSPRYTLTSSHHSPLPPVPVVQSVQAVSNGNRLSTDNVLCKTCHLKGCHCAAKCFEYVGMSHNGQKTFRCRCCAHVAYLN